MCFSATASFTAAALLTGAGAATLAQKPAPREIPFAAIPLIFAAHQAIEGAIWLKIGAGVSVSQCLIVPWLIIAQVLWPAYIPASVILLDERPQRPWALWALLVAGLIVSGVLAGVLIQHPYSVTAVAEGLRYSTHHRFENQLLGLYLIAATAPLLLSHHRFVVLFGVVVLAGSIVTMIAFYEAAASVWCFFAAIASVCVFLHQRRMAATRRAPIVDQS